MDAQTKKKIFDLRVKFEAYKAIINSMIYAGVSDNDEQIVLARHDQRMIAEELNRIDPAVKGIAMRREGDLKAVQRGMAKRFGITTSSRPQEDLDYEEGLKPAGEGKPPAQVVKLRTLYFQSEAGEILTINPQPSTVVGLESLRMEGKASSIKGRTLSVLEGSIGVDYEFDKDPESEIEFYVAITGGDDG